MIKFVSIIIFLILSAIITSCIPQNKTSELKHFPADDLSGIVAKSGIQIDKSIANDGHGSIKIEAASPSVIQLYSVSDVRVDDANLIYEAKVKSENLNGQGFLEMWCVFKDKGEFFSRGFDSVVSGTSDWKTIKTVFFLKKGEMPDQIKLNILLNGIGTVWIDDIHLLKIQQ